MGLYVMPRAVRACLPSEWLRGGKSVILVERYESCFVAPSLSPSSFLLCLLTFGMARTQDRVYALVSIPHSRDARA